MMNASMRAYDIFGVAQNVVLNFIDKTGDNELTGQIPSELGNIPSLQVIDIGKIL